MLVIHWTWFHPVFSFSSFKYDLFLMYVPVGSTAVAFAVSISLYYIFSNYGHARSQGGCQPAAVKSPLYMVHICKVPLRDVGDVKSRGWRKLKRDKQLRQAVTACAGGNILTVGFWIIVQYRQYGTVQYSSTFQYSSTAVVQVPYSTVQYCATVHFGTIQYSSTV